MTAMRNTKTPAPINIDRRDQLGSCCATRYRLTRFCVPLQPLEISATVGGMLVAQTPIFLQTLRNNPFKFGWEIGIESDWRNRSAVQNRVKYHSRRVTTKREGTCSHFVQHRAERKQVGASIKLLPAHLLGRHI